MLISLVLLACTDDWRYADIQLDISRANWQRESRIRTCVQDQQSHESALQAGRVAMDFLNVPLKLTVQLIPPVGEGDSASHQITESIDSVGYHRTEWVACEPIDCPPCQVIVGNEQGSELLAIRLDPDERVP